MHPASVFAEHDRQRLEVLLGERGLALIIGVDERGPAVAHAPVLLSADRLQFHLSAANRLTDALRSRPHALAVVSGDDAYVSPDWYATSDQVPTWNYLSVEAEGPVRTLAREETVALLDGLSARFEATLAPKPPWTRAKMAPARFESLLGGIVGFEMRLDRFEGVSKLSQNKSSADRERVAERLADRPDAASHRLAVAIRALARGHVGEGER